MQGLTINGKFFTREEICDYGKKSIKKTRTVLMIIGLGLVLFSVFISAVVIKGSDLPPTFSLFYCVPGVILIVISLIKATSDPYKAGISYLNRRFPFPVDFDGNYIEPLLADKIIELSNDGHSKLLVSSTKKQFQIVCDKKHSKIFSYQDIIEYEIRSNNEILVSSDTRTRKGVGKAIVGGLLFGGVGMVAGAIAGNSKSKTVSSQTEVTHFTLVIRVNDIARPAFCVELESLQVAEDAASTLAIICRENVQPEPSTDAEPPKDKFEEIKKYKELLDMGIITQEEFETEKKRILG